MSGKTKQSKKDYDNMIQSLKDSEPIRPKVRKK